MLAGKTLITTDTSLAEIKRKTRNKAIDDFAELLTHKIKSEIDDCADELEWIEEIAKQIRNLDK